MISPTNKMKRKYGVRKFAEIQLKRGKFASELRAIGVTLRDIAILNGVSSSRGDKMIRSYERNMAIKMRHSEAVALFTKANVLRGGK